jgi:Mg-chelatase subunit ChlD
MLSTKILFGGLMLTTATASIIGISAFKTTANGKANKSDSHAAMAYHAFGQKEEDSTSKQKIQVVFALDATGSMSGLIAAAKEKIWSVANSMNQTENPADIEIGLIFYRDRGDAFVTRQIALNKDIDAVYKELMAIDANGGGDAPESVNQALWEAVTKFAWDSTNAQTYKTIFLVGDCPPHMDYKNDVHYPISCAKAKQKDIILNAILMGNDAAARKVWNDIANCSQGSFVSVDMNVNDIAVATPYDDSISHLSDEVDKLRYYYGNTAVKADMERKKGESDFISANSSATVKAQRAEFNTSAGGKKGYYGSNELLNEIQAGNVSLEKLKETDLPTELQAIPKEQRNAWVQFNIARRDSLNKQLRLLSEKRQQSISEQLAKRAKEEGLAVDSSFNSIIHRSVQKQAADKKIIIKGKTKY